MSKPNLAKLWTVVCVLFLSSCGKYNLSAVNAWKPTYEDFKVDLGNRKIDVLFVVDNSGSMGTEQGTLSRSIDGFIGNFAGKPIDFHIGVISTDTVMIPSGNVRIKVPNGSGGTNDMDFPLSTFAFFNGPGSLFVRNIDLNGNAIINRSAPGFSVDMVPKYLDSMTMSSTAIQDRFKLDAKPGTSGDGDEAALLSISQFLQPASLSGWNAGFLRSDSLFSVVIVSDEDESFTGCNVNSIDPYLASQACEDRIDAGGNENDYVKIDAAAQASRLKLFNDIFTAQRRKRPALLSLDTVLGLAERYPKKADGSPGEVCGADSSYGGFTLQAASQTYNRGTNKKSKIHNLCVDDFSTSISSIGNVLATSVEDEFELVADRVDPDSVKVEINGNLLESDDYSYDSKTNQVRIKSFGVDTSTASGLLNIRIYYDRRMHLSEE